MIQDMNECELLLRKFYVSIVIPINSYSNIGGAALHSYLSNQKVKLILFYQQVIQMNQNYFYKGDVYGFKRYGCITFADLSIECVFHK